MATKEIKAADIPEWEQGDVMIKTFSFGEKLTLANFRAKINKDVVEFEDQGVNVKDISLTGLAAGIHFVRTKDGSGFIIKAGDLLESKEKVVYGWSFNAGQYLLQQIHELNKPLDANQKKK